MSSSESQAHKLDHKPFRVPHDKKIVLADYDTRYSAGLKNKKAGIAALLEDKTALADAQALLWANAERSLLIILQAMDAAGKDGAIKHVASGINPQGVSVYSFKAPSEEERLHHFPLASGPCPSAPVEKSRSSIAPTTRRSWWSASIPSFSRNRSSRPACGTSRSRNSGSSATRRSMPLRSTSSTTTSAS